MAIEWVTTLALYQHGDKGMQWRTLLLADLLVDSGCRKPASRLRYQLFLLRVSKFQFWGLKQMTCICSKWLCIVLNIF